MIFNNNKIKILWISDHALMDSGVATQSKFLMEGLLSTGDYSIYQFGAAKSHDKNTKTIKLSDDWIIEPIEGFGTTLQIRKILIQLQPDVVFIFTDPRFFTNLFEMEDEIHQFCPIVWWHVWDNYPFPEFNRGHYDGTDQLNCHSHMTYTMLCENGYEHKASFIPHAVPKSVYYPLSETSKRLAVEKYFPGKEDYWKCFWINKNFPRKRPGDLLVAWAQFVQRVETDFGHRKVCLFMHTDPKSEFGSDLVALGRKLGILDTLKFSTVLSDFSRLNEFYNCCDITINISHSEGFGLSTLESMMTGTPIIAPMTGGQTRQVIDYRDGSENGKALPIEYKVMNSSQRVPYIYEDWVSTNTIAQKIYEMFVMTPEEKADLERKVLEYVNYEFNYEDTVADWDKSIKNTISTWKDKYNFVSVEQI